MNAFNEDIGAETGGQVIDRVKSLAGDAGLRCHSACDKAKDIVTKNPVPAVFGVLVFGAAVGYLLFSRRDETLYNRLVNEAESARRRLSKAPGRLSSILNDGIGVASRRAHRASDFVHDLPTDEVIDTLSNSLHRACNRLKFW